MLEICILGILLKFQVKIVKFGHFMAFFVFFRPFRQFLAIFYLSGNISAQLKNSQYKLKWLYICSAQTKHPNEQSLKISAQSDKRFPRYACARMRMHIIISWYRAFYEKMGKLAQKVTKNTYYTHNYGL